MKLSSYLFKGGLGLFKLSKIARIAENLDKPGKIGKTLINGFLLKTAIKGIKRITKK